MSKGDCATCGMADVQDEFHPRALCLLVKARDGRTDLARSDMAYILRAARDNSSWLKGRIDAFLAHVAHEEANRG